MRYPRMDSLWHRYLAAVALCFACCLLSAGSFTPHHVPLPRHCRTLCQRKMAGDNGVPEKTQKEIRSEVQAAIRDANARVSSKFLSYEDITSDAIRANQKRMRKNKRTKTRAPTPAPNSSQVAALTEPELQELRERNAAAFQQQKFRLIGDHVFIAILIGSGVWSLVGFKAAASYGFGALFGTLYLVLLARFVEGLGEGSNAGGGGPARLALVAALVLICGKQKESLDLVPAVAGFLMYQVATLVQGLYPDTAE
ncbi:unnamed protein product [Chrysoparadoxa australica]